MLPHYTCVCTSIHVFVKLKILWFTKKLFLIFQVYTLSKELFWNLPLKSIRIFSLVLIPEVVSRFSRKIIVKIFQKFVPNVSKIFLTFLSKNFFNLSEISWIVMYGTSIDRYIAIPHFFDTSLVTSTWIGLGVQQQITAKRFAISFPFKSQLQRFMISIQEKNFFWLVKKFWVIWLFSGMNREGWWAEMDSKHYVEQN